LSTSQESMIFPLSWSRSSYFEIYPYPDCAACTDIGERILSNVGEKIDLIHGKIRFKVGNNHSAIECIFNSYSSFISVWDNTSLQCKSVDWVIYRQILSSLDKHFCEWLRPHAVFFCKFHLRIYFMAICDFFSTKGDHFWPVCVCIQPIIYSTIWFQFSFV